jgi:tellurite resistance protein
MIIWGSKGRTSTQSSGEFYCPDCSDYKNYAHRKVKKWFTLYFIPIFPMSDLGEYIECDICKSTYKINVLEHDPRKEQQKLDAMFIIATRDIMVKTALADGVIEEAEVDEIAKSFGAVTNRKISIDQIKSAISAMEKDQNSAEIIASSISPFLNDSGKEMVLRGAIAVSKSDGVVQKEELGLLHSLSRALELPKAYANGVFAEEGIEKL